MILAWCAFFTLSMVAYALVSDGDFSFLLTYAACTRSFGFFILCFRMYASKTGTFLKHMQMDFNSLLLVCTGSSVSLKSLEAYVVVFLFRILSIMRHEGYLPYDKSGDW